MPRSKHLNIVLLGSTGVGKSTLINSLANFFRYNSLNEAVQNGKQVLIGGTQEYADEDYVNHTINYQKTIEGPDELNIEANRGSTQEPKAYVFNFPDGDMSITIIDTPGVGDEKGPIRDKENFEKTLRFLSQYSVLHAICILMKADTSCGGNDFEYGINEMFRHLSCAAVGNLMFCFTNSAETNYTHKGGFEVLKNHLEILKQSHSIEVQLNNSNVYYFDCQCFRYLCELEYHDDNEDISSFEKSWTESVDSTKRLLLNISKLKPLPTISISNLRRNQNQLITTLHESKELLGELYQRGREICGKNSQTLANGKEEFNDEDMQRVFSDDQIDKNVCGFIENIKTIAMSSAIVNATSLLPTHDSYGTYHDMMIAKMDNSKSDDRKHVEALSEQKDRFEYVAGLLKQAADSALLEPGDVEEALEPIQSLLELLKDFLPDVPSSPSGVLLNVPKTNWVSDIFT